VAIVAVLVDEVTNHAKHDDCANKLASPSVEMN
jgi:hypothetical protein